VIYKRDSDFSSLTFGEYRKATLTRATRVRGPFTVETREGLLTCPDGYLAIDAHGWPYPIAADEFRRIYEAT
jgi:hypothetical protein